MVTKRTYPAVLGNRTSVYPVVTVLTDISRNLKNDIKNSIFLHELSDCQVYKASGSLKYYRQQVTNDANGHVTWALEPRCGCQETNEACFSSNNHVSR